MTTLLHYTVYIWMSRDCSLVVRTSSHPHVPPIPQLPRPPQRSESLQQLANPLLVRPGEVFGEVGFFGGRGVLG